MTEKDFESKGDRELLVLTAYKVDEIHGVKLPAMEKRLKDGERRFKDHETRLVTIETTAQVKKEFGFNGMSSKKKAVIVVGGVGGGGGIIGTAIMLIIAAGKILSWW